MRSRVCVCAIRYVKSVESQVTAGEGEDRMMVKTKLDEGKSEEDSCEEADGRDESRRDATQGRCRCRCSKQAGQTSKQRRSFNRAKARRSKQGGQTSTVD